MVSGLQYCNNVVKNIDFGYSLLCYYYITIVIVSNNVFRCLSLSHCTFTTLSSEDCPFLIVHLQYCLVSLIVTFSLYIYSIV